MRRVATGSLHTTAAWTITRAPKLTSSHAPITGGEKTQPIVPTALLPSVH
jgi:hypothetical protein